MVANGDEVCPLCAAKNENGRLTLFQVNLGQAIKLCSRKQCPYPIGTEQRAIPTVNRHASDIVIKRRKSSTKTSSRSSTCSTSSSSRCSTPADNRSPALTSPASQPPSVVQPFGHSGYIPSPPRPTRVVTLDEAKSSRNSLQPDNVVSSNPSRLQWRNKDALCWLDVVMCLLVHCKQLRKLLKSTNTNEQSILRTLITAYDQAQALFETTMCNDPLTDKTANLETSVGTITVKTGGGELSPITCLPVINCAQAVPNTVPQPDDDDDFFKCLDDLDFDAESTKLDIQTLENILEGNIDSPVRDQKSPVKTMVPSSTVVATVRDVGGNSKSKDLRLVEASMLLEDVRELVWQGISTKLRCRKGKDDSPVFALPLLLQQSQSVIDLFNLSFTWYLTCKQCGHKHVNPIQKTLTTFPNTPKHFNMTAPCFIRDCFNCKAGNLQMNMLYNRLPKVIMIHFVEGLPNNMTWSGLDFTQGANVYKVTGAVQFKTRPDHFVAWLRDPVSNEWMECDDMKKAQCDWSPQEPQFDMNQAHIVMWEKWSDVGPQSINFGFTPLDSVQPSSGFATTSLTFQQTKSSFAPVSCVPPMQPTVTGPNLATLNPAIFSNMIDQSKSLPSVTHVAKPLGNTQSGGLGQQSKAVCTAELVRQLVLNTKKAPNKEKKQTFQGYASSKSGSNSNPSSRNNSRSSSPVRLQVPDMNTLQSLKIPHAKNKRPAVIELDEKQNNERLKRVRENLMKLKQEKVASGGQTGTRAVKKMFPTVSPVAAKILASTAQEKPYVQICKPFLKKASASSEVTALLRQVGMGKKVFQGYSSKKAAKTSPKAPESAAQSHSVEQVTDTLKDASAIETVTSTSKDASAIETVASTSKDASAEIQSLKMKLKPKKMRTMKAADALIKKSVAFSPNKSVSFSPARPLQFTDRTRMHEQPRKTSAGVVRKIEFESDVPPAKKVAVTKPIVGSPKVTPVRPVPKAADIGMKRHTPSHVLKRMVSPPRGKIKAGSSGAALPSAVESSVSSELSGAKTIQNVAQRKKINPDHTMLFSYLERSSNVTKPVKTKKEASCQIQFVNATGNSIIAVAKVDANYDSQDINRGQRITANMQNTASASAKSSVVKQESQALDRVKREMLKRKQVTKSTPLNKRLKLLTQVSEESDA